MKARSGSLAQMCRRAMQEHLATGGEASLKRAYDVGRHALDHGFGVVEMVSMLHQALSEILTSRHPDEKSANTVRLTRDFFVESLSPFEMTHRGSQEVNAALRRLNEELNRKLEGMAKRIASALHDEAWQLMALIHIDLYRVAQELPEAAQAHLESVQGLLKELEQNLRRLSHEIRPRILDDLGIVPALEFLAKGLSERTGVPITVEGEKDVRFTPAVETNIYRIVQEALVNLTRHARATQAKVLVESGAGSVTCSVRDDGIGFDMQSVLAVTGRSGLGLLGIHERVAALGGTLDVASAPGKGTELRVVIPLERPGTNPAPNA